MSNQQQEFADPVTSYGDRRPSNTDPREQRGFMPPANNTDPREQPQWQAGQPPFMARPPQRGHSPWFWMGVGVLVLAVIFGGLALTGVLLMRTITETKSFSVGDQPTLVVTNGNGSVHVLSGPAGQISVVARKHIFMGDSNQLPIHYNESSDQKILTITVDDGVGFSFFGASMWVDFDVTVPGQANLNVQTGNGSLSATGISGQITLDSGNGSIDASQISGPMTMKTGNGSITTSQASASGNSTFKTGNGSIDFSGSLAPNGSYLFTSGNGSIDLTLPATASFRVEASAGNGSIDSDFSYVIGNTENGEVGSGPSYAQVTLQTGNGSIHLHKGS